MLLLFPWYADCTGLVVLRRVPEALSRSPIIRPEVVMIPAKDLHCQVTALNCRCFCDLQGTILHKNNSQIRVQVSR